MDNTVTVKEVLEFLAALHLEEQQQEIEEKQMLEVLNF